MRSYACYGWLMPATIENAEKLGIDEAQIKEAFESEISDEYSFDEPIQDWWDDVIQNLSDVNTPLRGIVGCKTFIAYLISVNPDDELDENMDDGTNCYFSFRFDELYQPTELNDVLANLGMKHSAWVTFG